MWHKDVKNRTFGFELEFGDADRSKITLPMGYSWTDNDLSRMHNSDGSPCTHTGQFGGEINTRPYKHTEEDLEECKNFIQSIKDAGGYLMWNEGFDAHFYIRDLPLDTIKKLFELSYWVAPYLKQIFDLAEWFENKYIAPSPDYSYVRKMNAVESIEEIPAVFANASHRGYIRFYLNFVPIDRIGTMEFRIFNSSWKWEETYETIKFMYNYVDYVVKNPDVEKFKEIDSIEKCIEAFKINPDLIPKKHNPLLWASEHNDFMTLVGESFKKPRAMMAKILEVADKFPHAHVVNSHYGDIEQVLRNQEVTVYTKSLFMYLFYAIIIRDEKFELTEPFGWMEMEKGTKAERLAKLLLFEHIKKCNNDNFYHQAKWNDYKSNFTKYVAKYTKTTEQIVKRLEKKNIDVQVGDILDALAVCCDEDNVMIYQSEFNNSLKSVDNALMYHAGIGWEKIKTPYSQVDLSHANYVAITKMKYMGLPKIFRNNRLYLYSNVDVKGENRYSGRPLKPVLYKKLPDDHEITRDSQIKFIRAKMSEIDYLRAIYMKKDILLGGAPFNYLWFVDDYLVGACMFDYSKQAGSGGDKIWMKSDFVIDSEQDKLSKLLIMATCSREFKDELDIRYRTDTQIITTTVFTNNSVSMKYRGVFKLVKREKGKLYYEQEAGRYASLKEVMIEWLKKRK